MKATYLILLLGTLGIDARPISLKLQKHLVIPEPPDLKKPPNSLLVKSTPASMAQVNEPH